MISLGGFNPEKINSRHVEANLVNPEYNIERLNAHQNPNISGKVGNCEPEIFCDPNEILGRSMVSIQPKSNLSPELQPLDCNSLFSDEEIKAILKKAGRPNTPPCAVYTTFKDEPEFDVSICKGDRLVINNKNWTNDTTVIFADGKALHVGSSHKIEIAPEGTCVGVVQEAKNRYFNK